MMRITAKDVMTDNVMKVRADWSLQSLAEFFFEMSISGAPVTNEKGELAGVVSSTDLISNGTMAENDPQSHGPHEYYLHNLEKQYAQVEISSFSIINEPLTTVGDIMTPTIYKVSEDTPVQIIAEKMIKNRIHRIFVTSKEKVVGIISSADMLRVIRDM